MPSNEWLPKTPHFDDLAVTWAIWKKLKCYLRDVDSPTIPKSRQKKTPKCLPSRERENISHLIKAGKSSTQVGAGDCRGYVFSETQEGMFERWMFPKIGVGPQNGWFIMVPNPIKMGWFGGTIIFWNTQMEDAFIFFYITPNLKYWAAHCPDQPFRPFRKRHKRSFHQKTAVSKIRAPSQQLSISSRQWNEGDWTSLIAIHAEDVIKCDHLNSVCAFSPIGWKGRCTRVGGFNPYRRLIENLWYVRGNFKITLSEAIDQKTSTKPISVEIDICSGVDWKQECSHCEKKHLKANLENWPAFRAGFMPSKRLQSRPESWSNYKVKIRKNITKKTNFK